MKTVLLEHPDNYKSSKTRALGHGLQPHALREHQQDAASKRAGSGAMTTEDIRRMVIQVLAVLVRLWLLFTGHQSKTQCYKQGH